VQPQRQVGGPVLQLCSYTVAYVVRSSRLRSAIATLLFVSVLRVGFHNKYIMHSFIIGVHYVNINVTYYIYRRRRMSRVRIGGAGGREMLDRVVCSSKQFGFQMCLESGDGSGTFRNWRQRGPDSWCRDAECLGLEIDPCRRLSSYALVY